jgi:DNA-binding phage protein
MLFSVILISTRKAIKNMSQAAQEQYMSIEEIYNDMNKIGECHMRLNCGR